MHNFANDCAHVHAVYVKCDLHDRDQILRNEHGQVSEHFKKLESMQCNCHFQRGSMAMTGSARHSNSNADAESGAAEYEMHGSDVSTTNAEASESRGHALMRGLTCPCAIQCLSRLQEHVHTSISFRDRFNIKTSEELMILLMIMTCCACDQYLARHAYAYADEHIADQIECRGMLCATRKFLVSSSASSQPRRARSRHFRSPTCQC